MAENVFLKNQDFYQRKLDPIAQYVEQSSFYLHRMTGRSLSDCQQHVITSIKIPESGIQNPTVRYFERNDQGDRFPEELPLSDYINQVVRQEEILAPSFTSYLNTKKQPSILVEFTDNNKRVRGVAKKEAFAAKVAGLSDLFIIKDNQQTNMKLYNNSMSGAFATKGSVLHNPSAHSTLTSITRSVVSISNASNEKILEGNRHYYNPDITLNNLISITSAANTEILTAIIEKYALVYPSVEGVMECVKHSTDLYWRDSKSMDDIQAFVNTLTMAERAAVVYTGDMYHIRQHNPNFIRNLLTHLSQKVTDVPVEDALKKIHQFDEQLINFAHQVCISEMRGMGKDYEKLPVNDLNTLVATCSNIEQTVLSYKDFIETFFLTENMPNSTAMLPNLIRRAVLVSDTDSTLFSVDSWVQWYFGEIRFNDESFALAGAVMYIATQCMAHALAIFSANMNVERVKLFDLQMKPEFVFPVFAQTAVAKHYYTMQLVREANVFIDPEMEIKGVYLKDSSLPKTVIKDSQDTMKNIVMAIYNNEKISITKLLKHISDKEVSITDSLLNGHVEFYKKSKIKEPASYAGTPEQSPYLHHMFWQSVFEAKYGQMEAPPYLVVKIPTILYNVTAVKKFIDAIEDRALATRFAEWLSKYKKTSLPTIYLSESYVQAFGIPEEIKPIIDVKKIVLQLTGADRMITDSIGFCLKDGYLVSELGY